MVWMTLSAPAPAISASLAAPVRRVRSTLLRGKGADMTDKSPRKTASKKSGKSLKEKRQAKKDKEQTRKGLTR
jgi:hypothetical protein